VGATVLVFLSLFGWLALLFTFLSRQLFPQDKSANGSSQYAEQSD
jgi:multidrug efflux pump subunit AcrB